MKTPAKAIALASAVLAAALAASCSGDSSAYATLDAERGWAYGDTVALRPVGQSVPAALSVALRHNNDYAFSNIWLEVSYEDGGVRRRDTVNLVLADVYGRWKGQGFGAMRQMVAEVNPSARVADSSMVAVRHIMRVDSLRGLDRIGIILK